MYATSLRAMAQSLGLGFLAIVGRLFLYVALAAWAAACIGPLHQLVARASRRLTFGWRCARSCPLARVSSTAASTSSRW